MANETTYNFLTGKDGIFTIKPKDVDSINENFDEMLSYLKQHNTRESYGIIQFLLPFFLLNEEFKGLNKKLRKARDEIRNIYESGNEIRGKEFQLIFFKDIFTIKLKSHEEVVKNLTRCRNDFTILCNYHHDYSADGMLGVWDLVYNSILENHTIEEFIEIDTFKDSFLGEVNILDKMQQTKEYLLQISDDYRKEYLK